MPFDGQWGGRTLLSMAATERCRWRQWSLMLPILHLDNVIEKKAQIAHAG